MNKILLSFLTLAVVLAQACAPSPTAKPSSMLAPARQRQSPKFSNSAESKSSPAFVSGHSPAPQTILVQVADAFSKLESLRIRETLEWVSGSHATYEIEVLLPDKEHLVSRGVCTHNRRGESITIDRVVYSRCGTEPWRQTLKSGKGSHKAYLDYLQNSSAFAIRDLERTGMWVIITDYRGDQVPPGTMTWFIGRQDFLPRKLMFMNPGGYSLVAEFKDFDDRTIAFSAPLRDETLTTTKPVS